jgi:hypothetical protein
MAIVHGKPVQMKGSGGRSPARAPSCLGARNVVLTKWDGFRAVVVSKLAECSLPDTREPFRAQVNRQHISPEHASKRSLGEGD